MNWGKGIVIVFIGFALFIGTLVTVCVKQEMSLVSPDYYQQELEYQDQIDRLENTSALQALPSIIVVNDSLKLVYKDFSTVTSGVLKLTRASSARYDASFTIPAGKNINELSYPLGNLPRGRYKGSFEWVMDGKEYYVDQPIDL